MKTTKTVRTTRIEQWIWYGFVAIAIGLPFHAFLITWIGSFAPRNVSSLLRYWKEFILIAMSAATVILIVRENPLRKRLLADRFAWILSIFTLLHLCILLVYKTSPFAGILGLKINLAFLLLYLILSLTQIRTKITTIALSKLVLIPAAIVGLLGTLQTFVLPHDILTHFGYGPVGGPNPAYYVIENTDTIRVMSTLWGPNQFGSYLVLPLTLSFWWLIKGTNRQKLFSGTVFILDLLSLYGSQSRGAWLATAFALLVVFILQARGFVRLAIAGAGIILIGAIIFLAAHHKLPTKINTLILHGESAQINTGYISSNGGHVKALTLGFDRLQAHPFGAGLEAAGRASEGTADQLYTENFFLQLAVQVGYEGIAIFLILCVLIAWRLIATLHLASLSLPLLASFIGLSINNLFAHTWSDGATAWIWWGLAGIIFATSQAQSKVNNVQA